jgi:hypothetical protein
MKLFGIEGKGLIISVGITIIMCGAVTYYCHMRVKNVEVALMKQNQVLTSFITNVQSEIRKGGLIDNAHVDLSSPEARNAVKNLENSKIEVSDDEDASASEDETDASDSDDDEDDSASETDAGETDDSESDDDEETDISNSIKISKEDIKIVDIQVGSLNDFMNDSKIIDLEEITDFANLHNETEEDDSDDESISDDESVSATEKVSAIAVKNIKPEVKKINLSEIIVDNKQELLVEVDVELDENEETNSFIKKIVKTEDKEKTSNINKMKIDELREKAVLSGLGTIESLKKLKKADLITLLTNNKQ